MKIIGINGIRTDGSTSTDLILKGLRKKGYSTQDFNYPQVGIFSPRFKGTQYEIAHDLVKIAKENDCVVAHSFGCLVTLRAMELGAKFKTVFWFAPAMNSTFEIPKGACEKLYVIHYPEDWAIFLGSLLFFHDFGKMGRVGYQGPKDERVTNVVAKPKEKEFWNHSHYFIGTNLEKWVSFVDKNIQKDK